MSLTIDQKIQVWNAVGTWLAGIATFCAVLVSLHLARRQEKVKLHVEIGMRIILGDGERIDDLVIASITNLGARPVRIDSLAWKFPRKKVKWRYAMQNFGGPYSERLPKLLEHGERAAFTFSDEDHKWSKSLNDGEGGPWTDRELKKLRAVIYTSVNQRITVKPEADLLERLRQARDLLNKTA